MIKKPISIMILILTYNHKEHPNNSKEMG